MASIIYQSTIPSTVRTFYEKAALERAIPALLHSRFGEKAVVPKNKGTIYEWHKWTAMSAITTALDDEAIVPASETYSISTVTATPSPYGGYVRYTEEFDMSDPDGGVLRISELLGEQCGLSIDTMVRDTIAAGYTAEYGGTATSTATVATGDTMDMDDVLDAIAKLLAGGAQPQDGTNYKVILHPYAWADLMKDSDFQAVFANNQPGGSNIFNRGYIGTALMCDWYLSYNGYVHTTEGASSQDVYATLFIGKGGYGTAGLGVAVPDPGTVSGQDNKQGVSGGKSPVSIIIQKDGSDPFQRKSTVAWLVRGAWTILTAAFVVGLENSI